MLLFTVRPKIAPNVSRTGAVWIGDRNLSTYDKDIKKRKDRLS